MSGSSDKWEEAEQEEKASATMHTTKALFPEGHLAPWLTWFDGKPEVFAVAMSKTVGDSVGLISWMREHKADLRKHGAAFVVTKMADSLVTNMGDYAVSRDALGRRQAHGISMAQKTGLAAEPKKRGLLDKLLGRNKVADKLTGEPNG